MSARKKRNILASSIGLQGEMMRGRNAEPAMAIEQLSGEYRCWYFLDYVEDIDLAGRLLRPS